MTLLGVELGLAAATALCVAVAFPIGPRRWLSAARNAAQAAREAWKTDPPSHRWGLAGVGAVAVLVRLINLRQPMRLDEAWSYLHYSARPLSVALSDYTLPNNHLLHTLLVLLTTRVFGSAPWAVRLPALIAGLLIVPATYLVARRLADRTAGLWAAALVAALPSLIIYSTNGRGYTMICLATLLLLLLADGLAREDSPILAAAFAVVTALGMYAIPVMLYPAGAMGLWAILERGRRQGRTSALRLTRTLAAAAVLAGLLTAMAYAPVVVGHGVAPLVSNRFVSGHDWSRFLAELPAFAASLPDALIQGIPPEIRWALLGAAALAFWNPRLDRTRAATLIATVLAWIFLVLVVTRRPPPGRVWLFLAPLFCVYAGAGLAYLIEAGSRRIRLVPSTPVAGAVLLAAGLSLFSILRHPDYESFETDSLRDGEAVAAYLRTGATKDDRVIVGELTGPSLDYYLVRCCGKRLGEFVSPARTGRLLVILDEQRGVTVDSLMRYRSDVAWQNYGTPALLQKFSATSIYAATPKRSGGPEN